MNWREVKPPVKQSTQVGVWSNDPFASTALSQTKVKNQICSVIGKKDLVVGNHFSYNSACGSVCSKKGVNILGLFKSLGRAALLPYFFGLMTRMPRLSIVLVALN